ncbi:hypothetical protein AVI51_00525 [Piscirickettsia salmonis]|uniref:hypothetical protein n=1 Tax=Piscirickettsia salmonis TaxID=1238 RepID=UPI00050EA7C8|nr:hypothetical protein [Piscirickettsia salmonis]APS44886.1 hypothetical protein AVI48_11255 [Piscirickettsia salmonis]APS48247.1 hypothetical protein AVI49_11865 [Piscirickettsia salmonis]APS49512.1 hypothetical protein AVI50_00550 [Piscirickettsia salmonis]APS52691.1 hypothetical protein AVI51_00525 [Piscirickettsia salmonis]QHS32549.1 hypothetical protein GW535_08670 [Piscirickettsia salmonis]
MFVVRSLAHWAWVDSEEVKSFTAKEGFGGNGGLVLPEFGGAKSPTEKTDLGGSVGVGCELRLD